MDVTESSSTGGSRGGGGSDEPPVVKPLMRNGYRRLAKVELQIADAAMLDGPAIVERARQRDEGAPNFLGPEALVYFIRDAVGNGEERIRDGLIRELLERCNPHFRGTFRGFSREDREDLQGEVLRMIVEDLLASDDRGDFMQVRFWSYLKRRCIDACRVTFRHTEDTESLETGFLGEGGSEGQTRLDREVDPQLSPEALAMISEALKQLPQNLRHVFLLRHYVGMKIGTDSLADDDGGELTIAAQFGRTGRTIRNWLNEASRLLAEFQEEQDDGK